ncbi:peptide chain release factor 1 [Candidatus Woesearchaeota archaeon]|nr:peptide chain release factor 1 [Candidatus Woesearchaeota archaeon]
MDIKQKLAMRKLIKKLESIRGRHTELVSVYIPAGYDMIKIIQHLQQEQGTASNIKDANTRNNVIDSLERMIRHLRLYKQTPPNGLAVFSGNASDHPSKVVIEVWSIEPPEPLNFRLYRCDQTFMLDPLKEMMEHKHVYGLIVLDRRDASIGVLKGNVIKEIASTASNVPGKAKTGGQSAMRYARIRLEMKKEFFKRVGELANQAFLTMKDLKGILVGGPVPTKDEFVDGDYLNNELKKKIVAMQDLSYTGDFGLQELVDKSKEVLAKEDITKEKKVVNEFFEVLRKEPGRVAYGKAEVNTALEMGAVDKLLLSENLPEEELEELQEKGEKLGAEVHIISIDTMEGGQIKGLGGYAAILRYSLK